MGCDIHAHVEIKISGYWVHAEEVTFVRNYEMFSFIAGVRSSEGDPVPLSGDRGLPGDISPATRLRYYGAVSGLGRTDTAQGEDFHSEGYLLLKDMVLLDEKFQCCIWLPGLRFKILMYILGHSPCDWKEAIKWGSSGAVQDIRLVFWFDN